MPPRQPYLTKSRFLAGQQCALRLWSQVNDPLPHEESEEGSVQALGIAIGQEAHRLFPGGVLVDHPPYAHEPAVRRTRELMADRRVPAIFEAAFEAAGVRVRVDILERGARGRWRLTEVKSSGSVKDVHLDDLAVQGLVVEEAGVRLESAGILHVNKAYVRGKGAVDWKRFFTRADRTADFRSRVEDLPGAIAAMARIARLRQAPAIDPGRHCDSPYECEFQIRCHRGLPKDWIGHLYRISDRKFEALKAAGIAAIRDIPEDFDLNHQQQIIRQVLKSRTEHVSPDLTKLLAKFGPPAAYLDFESMAPIVPLYPKTRPFESLPFQWSLHVWDGKKKPTHDAFLADGMEDPRRAFIESLLAAVKRLDLPILVFSSFEMTTLKQMAALFPDLTKPIERLMARLCDLLPVVQGGIYHADFQNSFSIKTVAPALAPHLTYDDLETVADGLAAAQAFESLAAGRVQDKADIANLRQALLDYCQRDTLALVEVHKALLARAPKQRGRGR